MAFSSLLLDKQLQAHLLLDDLVSAVKPAGGEAVIFVGRASISLDWAVGFWGSQVIIVVVHGHLLVGQTLLGSRMPGWSEDAARGALGPCTSYQLL
jgi:hypothetical protein